MTFHVKSNSHFILTVMLWPSIFTTFEQLSIPTVGWRNSPNTFSFRRKKMEDLPTPASPRRTTLNIFYSSWTVHSTWLDIFWLLIYYSGFSLYSSPIQLRYLTHLMTHQYDLLYTVMQFDSVISIGVRQGTYMTPLMFTLHNSPP